MQRKYDGKKFEVIVGQSGPPTKEKLIIIATLSLLFPLPAPSTEHFRFFLLCLLG